MPLVTGSVRSTPGTTTAVVALGKQHHELADRTGLPFHPPSVRPQGLCPTEVGSRSEDVVAPCVCIVLVAVAPVLITVAAATAAVAAAVAAAVVATAAEAVAAVAATAVEKETREEIVTASPRIEAAAAVEPVEAAEAAQAAQAAQAVAQAAEAAQEAVEAIAAKTGKRTSWTISTASNTEEPVARANAEAAC